MNPELLKTIISISPFFVLIPIFVSSFQWKNTQGYYKWIFLYLGVNLIADSARLSYGKWAFLNYGFCIFTWFPSWSYWSTFANSFYNKKYTSHFLILVILFCIFSVINSTWIQPFETFNSNGRVIESIAISAVFSTILLKLSENTEVKILDQPRILDLYGIFVYFTSSIFIFGYSNSILFKNRNWNLAIWSIHAIVVLVQHALISIGFIKLKINVWIHLFDSRNRGNALALCLTVLLIIIKQQSSFKHQNTVQRIQIEHGKKMIAAMLEGTEKEHRTYCFRITWWCWTITSNVETSNGQKPWTII